MYTELHFDVLLFCFNLTPLPFPKLKKFIDKKLCNGVVDKAKHQHAIKVATLFKYVLIMDSIELL